MIEAKVPDFVHALAVCKAAYLLAREEYSNGRMVRREFEHVLPKRKHGPNRVYLRVARKMRETAHLNGPVVRMIAAAYDQGLFDEHEAEGDAR